VRWLLRLFRKAVTEKRLDAELRFHLEQQIADDIAGGTAPEEARRRARMEFGGLEQIKEDCRNVHWEIHLESLFRDLRYALRGLRKDRRFSFVTILALALGIGSATVMFSVVYNVVFNPLPYKDFNRWTVFRIHGLTNVGGWKGRSWFSIPEFLAFRDQNHVFEEMVGSETGAVLYDDGKSSRVYQGAYVTTNTFNFYGIPPLLGRAIRTEDATSGAPPVFVMNYRLWRADFNEDTKILGATFLLNDKPMTLVGIMPPRFDAYGADIWLPFVLSSGVDHPGTISIMARLKPGVTMQTAASDLDVIEHRFSKADPGAANPEQFAIVTQSLLDSLLGNFRKTLYALLVAVLLLLLVACSNVANLLLARATVREREMAMCASMGATRGRLIRQLLVESFVLAAMASFAGCALAYLGLKAVVALIPVGMIPEETAIRMNGPVLLLSLGITILTTLLCGLAPTLHVARSDLQPRLTGTGKGLGGSFRHGKLRAGLVITEVALSIVLLIGAGLLLRSFFVLTRVDLGFNPKNVLYIRPWFPRDQYKSAEKQNVFTRQLLQRMKALPGVSSVSESMLVPPLAWDWSDTIIPGKPHAERWVTRFELCSEGYFQTIGLQLLRGRLFSEGEVDAARHVTVINQTLARQYFPNEDPLGRKIKFQILDRPFLDAPHDTYFEIIGIVTDFKTRDYEDPSWQSSPQAYLPYSIQGFSYRTFMARTSVNPDSLLQSVSQEIWGIDPRVGISNSGSIERSLKEFYRGPQFELVTLGLFACIGLVLVMIGIFSVMAYTVSLQTHDIGIRMALGAQQQNILGMVLDKGLRLVVAGIAIGLPASYVATRFLASQISGVSVTDPWTYGAVVAVILLVGLAACFLPARQATRVDPLTALRYE
jgi:putative ABC transport system permease protein